MLLSLKVGIGLTPIYSVASSRCNFVCSHSFDSSISVRGECIQAIIRADGSGGLNAILGRFPNCNGGDSARAKVTCSSHSCSRFRGASFGPFCRKVRSNTSYVLISRGVIGYVSDRCPTSLSRGIRSVLEGRFGFSNMVVASSLVVSTVASFAKSRTTTIATTGYNGSLLYYSSISARCPTILRTIRGNRVSRTRISTSMGQVLG